MSSSLPPLGVPNGVPTFVYGVIKPSPSGDAVPDVTRRDSFLLLSDPGKEKGREFEVDEVFEGLDFAKIYGGIFGGPGADSAASARPNPLKTFVDTGMSVATFFVGAVDGGKTRHFQGAPGGGDYGGIGYSCERLFEMLKEKEEGAVNQYKYEVRISFYELFDEVVSDLLDLNNRELDIRIDPAKGAYVQGATSSVCVGLSDVLTKLEYGRKSRKTQVFSTGPAFESTAAIFDLSLRQLEGESSNSMQSTVSRLLFVDVPATDKLVASPDKLRLKEGPTLPKGLLSFVDLCKVLSSTPQSQPRGGGANPPPPFDASKFTSLLEDTLGGNSIVLCVACVAQGSPKVTKETLGVAKLFRKMVHYPLENSEIAQGLLAKYRSAIAALLDRVEGMKVASGQPREGDAAITQRLQELETVLVKAGAEASTAKEDGAKVYKMLELFKAKYAKLVEDKARQAAELIASEEQKLEISKALLEAKLKASEVAEAFETEKYEITTAMLNAKNEVSDLDIKLHDNKSLLVKSESQEASALRDREEIRKELQRLHEQSIAMKEKLALEQEKNVEVGAELLTLLNQKESFSKMNASLHAKCETLESKLKDHDEQRNKNKAEIARLTEELEKEKVALENVRGEKLKLELELRKTVVGFEQSRLDTDKSTAEFSRSRDNEMFQIRKAAEEDVIQIRREKDDVMKAHSRMEASVRQLERKLRDSEGTIERLKESVALQSSDKKSLEVQLNSAREHYRSKLLSYLGEEAMAAALVNDDISRLLGEPTSGSSVGGGNDKARQGGGGAANDAGDPMSQSTAASEANSRAALEDLIKTYKERERQIREESEKLRAVNAEITRKNHLLYDKYNQVRDALEDAAPENSGIVPPPLPKENELKVSASEIEQQREAELNALRVSVKHMQSDSSAEKEKSVQVSEQYRSMVQQMEGRLKDLAQQLNGARADKERLEKDILKQKDTETLKQIEEMQQNIIDQLSQMQQENVKKGAAGGDKGAAGGKSDTHHREDQSPESTVSALSAKERSELNDLRKFKRAQKQQSLELSKLQDENSNLKQEAEKLQDQVSTGGGGGGGGGFRFSPAAASSGGTEVGNKFIMAQLHKAEETINDLQTKNAMLEQEVIEQKQYTETQKKKFLAEIKKLSQGR